MTRKINKIVFHHSLTPRDLNIDKSIQSFDRTHKGRLHPKANWYWLHIAYHYVIDAEGNYRKTRPINEIGYHAWNWNVNKESIGICCLGNFDKEEPTAKQYVVCRQLINEIKTQRPNATIHWHKEFATRKTCPWKNFELVKLQSVPSNNKKEQLLCKLLSYMVWKGWITNPRVSELCHVICEIIRGNR